MKRASIPLLAFLLGCALATSFYLGIMTWAQDWGYASAQFSRDRGYLLPIILGFGVQAGLYTILRFRLFLPVSPDRHAGAVIGSSGGTSAATMVACCVHHVADALPILGLSAAATFLTRYQRPVMLAGLGINLLGIAIMLVILYRERRRWQPALPETS